MSNISTMIYNSSDDDDDDDDVYTNAAARLKALKATTTAPTIIPEDINEEIPEEIIINDHVNNTESIIYDPVVSQQSTCQSTSRARRRVRAATMRNMNSPSVYIDLDASIPSPQFTETDSLTNDDICTEIIDCDPDIPNTIEKNYMMDVKVRWRSREIERIKLGMNEKFAKIFQYFASLENVPENQILLTRQDIPINHSDTPVSVNLKIIDILEGGIVDTTFANNTDDGEPVCKIKVQSSTSTRHCLNYVLGKSQTFEKLFEYCSKQKNISLLKIKLTFDGELVSSSDTPDSLDLDDEACFDLQII